MVDVPPETPVTTPEPVPTVATLVVLLLHVPPPASVNEVVCPPQSVGEPVIAAGEAFTVKAFVDAQPVVVEV